GGPGVQEADGFADADTFGAAHPVDDVRALGGAVRGDGRAGEAEPDAASQVETHGGAAVGVPVAGHRAAHRDRAGPAGREVDAGAGRHFGQGVLGFGVGDGRARGHGPSPAGSVWRRPSRYHWWSASAKPTKTGSSSASWGTVWMT